MRPEAARWGVAAHWPAAPVHTPRLPFTILRNASALVSF